MTFWSIVLGLIAVVLLLAWRYDRRRGASVRTDIWNRTDQATAINIGKGQQAAKSPVSGLNEPMGP